MNIKQVTVFGGSGFVGRAIVRALAPQGYLIRVACRRIELAEPLKTAGDVGQITLMRANLRMPQLGGRRRRRQRGRDQCRGHPLPARPPALSGGPCRGRPGDRRGGARRGRRSAWSISRASAPTAAARRTATSSPRSRPRTPSSPAFESATILRPSVVFGPDDAMFNRLAEIAAQAPFMPRGRRRPARVQPVFVGRRRRGRRRRAGAARHGQERVRAGRPAGLHLSRDRRAHPARDRPPEADHRRAGRPDEDRRLLRQQIARLGLVPPITPDQVDLLTTDNVVRPRRQDPGDLGIAADGGRGHPADLSRPLPRRRPLQPARPGLIARNERLIGSLLRVLIN